MNDVLAALPNRWVEVRSQGGEHSYRNEGKLVAYDDRWIQNQVMAPSRDMACHVRRE